MSDDLSGFSMMDLFRMEAEERLAVLSQGLVALEGTGATAEVIEPLMRAAHSLKGAARIVGLDAAVRVAHAMEDCLVAAQKGQVRLEPAHIDALLVGVDLLVQVSKISEGEQESWQSSHGDEVERLVANLAAIQAGQAFGTTATPSPATALPIPESPIIARSSGSTPARTVPGNRGAGLAASAGVSARSWSRRRGTGRPGGARDRGEPDKADGTGRGIVGPDAPIPSVRRFATASEEPSDRTPGNAPAARGSPVERWRVAAGRGARAPLHGQGPGRSLPGRTG